jgi:hypothetical protein
MGNLTGQQFGNYRLIRQLGTGGFGEVYLGQHIHIQREAAIKILLKLEPEQIAQFRQEAQIIANLTHPGIVTIFDYDVAGEVPFIVMQYAQQGTLRTHYRRGTQVPPGEVVTYITQAARALQFAHDHRIVHRDIKPENMLLGPNGDLLLSDFGIAIVWSSTRSVGVQSASGTLAYMPPEQILKHPRTASDQYSLAITAYEWLSGERPLAGSAMGLGMIQIQHPDIKAPSLRHTSPQIPPQIDAVLQRALASDWQIRFPTIREFAHELERAIGTASHAPISAPPPPRPAFSPGQYTYTPIPQALPSGAQYAPPPPGLYHLVQGAAGLPPVPPVPVARPQAAPLTVLAVISKVLSVIGMITGLLLALLGFLGFFAGGEGLYTDLWVGGLLCFLGLLIFFLARMRRSLYPVPRARKIEAAIGTYTGLFATALGVTIVIVGIVIGPIANSGGAGLLGGVICSTEGVLIWLVSRRRITRTP